jgi:hypothetical protein
MLPVVSLWLANNASCSAGEHQLHAHRSQTAVANTLWTDTHIAAATVCCDSKHTNKQKSKAGRVTPHADKHHQLKLQLPWQLRVAAAALHAGLCPLFHCKTWQFLQQ